jgi:hypothetical protein
MKKTTVVIQEYTPGKEQPRALATITVPTGRLLLSDMNRDFYLGKRELNAAVPYDLADLAAVQSFRSGGDKPPPDPKDPKAKPPSDENFDSLLEFNVLYDGKPVERTADNRLPTPKEGQKVTFTMKAAERLGVVLRVNGVNTLGEEDEEREPDQYSMWILEPGKKYTIRGYYSMEQPKGKGGKGETFIKPFRVLSESESVLAPLANESKRGKIELIVFREASGDALPDASLRPASLRTVSGRGKTLQDIRDHIQRVASASLSRGLVTPGDALAGPAIRTVTFEGVVAGHRALTYFEIPR